MNAFLRTYVVYMGISIMKEIKILIVVFSVPEVRNTI